MIHSLPSSHPLPELRHPPKGTGRRLQGGEPPTPYRSRNLWGQASKQAPEPFNCRAIRGEVKSDRKYL